MSENLADNGASQTNVDAVAASSSKLIGALDGMLSRNGSALAGRVHLVGLAVIKERLGKKWEALKSNVHDITENIICKHIRINDVFERYGDDQYLLIFADQHAEISKSKLLRISKEIYSHFLGKEELRDVRIKTAVHKIDGKVGMKDINLDSMIEDLASQALKSNVGDEFLEIGPEDEIPAGPFNEGRVQARTPVPCDPVDTNGSLFERGADRYEKLRDRFASFKALSVAYQFRPVWDLKQQVISTFQCTPTCVMESGNRICGYNILTAERTDEEIANLDLCLLEHGLDVFGESFANNFRFFIIISVHFATLSNLASRTEFKALCEIVPQPLRSYILFDINGIPAGVPFGRLSEVTQPLRGYGKFLFARAAEKARSFPSYQDVGIKAVSMEYDFGPNPLKTKMAVIEKFGSVTRLAGLNAFLIGVDDLQAVVAADKANIALLAGDIIGEPLDFPMASRRFTRKDFMKQISG